jgi:drug/metabolite transporter (DMT)-like permease
MTGPARLRAISLMIGSMAMFASMDALNKTLTQGYPIAQIMAIRFVVFVALACAIAKRGPWLVFETKAPWLQALRTFVLLLEMAAFIVAFKYLPLAEVHAVAAAAPLLATALAALFLKERVDPIGWGLVAGGMFGAILVVGPAFGDLGPAMWIAVAATLLWGVYQVLTRLVARHDSADVTTLHTPLVGLVLAWLVAIPLWTPPDALGRWAPSRISSWCARWRSLRPATSSPTIISCSSSPCCWACSSTATCRGYGPSRVPR